MKVSKAEKFGSTIIRSIPKKNTVRAHSFVKGKFCQQFGDYDISDLTVDSILDFMNQQDARPVDSGIDGTRCDANWGSPENCPQRYSRKNNLIEAA